MNAGKTLDTKRLKSSQRPYFDKSNLKQVDSYVKTRSLVVGANFC